MINIKIDSRKVKKGDIFVALRGSIVDGHDYVNKAIENGAVKVVVEEDIKCSVPKLIVKDTKKWLSDYVYKHYSKELEDIDIIGVTGTNGKTTTAFLAYQMLNSLGAKTAYIGTIGFYIPGEMPIKLENTTPNILDLYDVLLTAKSKGCKTVVMELSSHALHQKRVRGLRFKVAAFTNLTHEHLDYHKTMRGYLNAKMLLLRQLDGKMIVNVDDKYGKYWLQKYDNCLSLGENGKDYTIKKYEDTEIGTKLEAEIFGKKYEIEYDLRSRFNVYNYLTAMAMVNSLGYSIEDIIKISKDIKPPKGRCELIKVGKVEVIIDYAHTPDAVEKVFDAFSNSVFDKVITVIGSAGDRDVTKRPIMGKLATTRSDYVIFTTDNPCTEDPKKIIDDIVAGVDTNNYEVELDREKAIIKALDMADGKDLILLLGKGHEDYQLVGNQRIPFSEAEIVKKYKENKKK